MLNIETYFNNYFKGTKKPSLDVMRYFMNEYNNFEKSMKFIHIAGTNGKGSCVEMINNILLTEGYTVGKFISPHLIRYNERISINNKEISDEELEELIHELEPKINEYNLVNKVPVTFFEITTIIALLYFYKKSVDFVILETGLGGLYDCTNIISSPLVSIITSIGYDHMHILGNTLTEIAFQKAGIIKANSHTILFEQANEINQIFIDTCKQKNNELSLIRKSQISNYKFDENYQYFDFYNFHNISIVLKGKKQVINAAICIECMKILNNLGYKISEQSIRQGLKTVIHKARMEILNKKPLIIYDGAHNEQAVENFTSMVNMYYMNFERIYIVSILKRKDYKKIIEILMKDEKGTFIFTSGNDYERYTSSEELYNISLKYYKNQKIMMKSLDEAIEYIFENCKNSATFFVGSFYIYGNVLQTIQEKQKNKRLT